MIAEKYTNSTYHYQPTIQTYRWWVPGYPLLGGGSVVSGEDWEHIKRDFGCQFCINVQNERSDVETVPDAELCEAQVDDAHAPPLPHPALAKVLAFARSHPPDTKLYVHCQMGGSRTPAFLYLILRGKYGLDKEEALATINRGFIVRERDHLGDAAQPYGHADGHWRYMNSIEAFLAAMPA